MKKLLTIAAILNFLLAFLSQFSGSEFSVVFLVGSGLFYLLVANEDEKELSKFKMPLIITALISLIPNIFSAVLVFVAVSKIEESKKKKVKPKVDPETRRIDLLLKLGVGMVFLSGMIFATTSWEVIGDLFKVFALIFISIVFYGLSVFVEKKLKLNRTSEIYFNLGSAFVVFTFIAIGFFSTFGTYFSFWGRGYNLVYAMVFLVNAFLGMLSFLRYKNNGYQIWAVIAIYLLTNALMMHFSIELAYRLMTLTIITIILNYYDRVVPHLKFFLAATSTVVLPSIYILSINQIIESKYYYLVGTLIIANMFYFSLREKKKEHFSNLIVPILTVLMVLTSVFNHPTLNEGVYSLVATGILVAAFSLSTTLIKKEALKEAMIIFINIGFVFIFFETILGDYLEIVTYAVASLILTTNLVGLIFNEKKIFEIETYIQPLKVLFFVYAMYLFFDTQFFNTDMIYTIHLMYFSMFILLVTAESEFRIKQYFIAFISLIVIGLLDSMVGDKTLPYLFLIAAFAGFVYSLLRNLKNKEAFTTISYFILLLTVFVQFVINDMFLLGDLFAPAVAILFYIMLATTFRETKNLASLTMITVLLPIYHLISNLNVSNDVEVILRSTAYLYFVIVLNIFILKNKSSREVITAILVLLIIFSVIFNPSLMIGLYVGMIGLIIMLIGFQYKEYLSLFYIGLLTLIINIIYQLRELWTKVPFWLYLLVIGLSLIVFVTYKEMQRINKK